MTTELTSAMNAMVPKHEVRPDILADAILPINLLEASLESDREILESGNVTPTYLDAAVTTTNVAFEQLGLSQYDEYDGDLEAQLKDLIVAKEGIISRIKQIFSKKKKKNVEDIDRYADIIKYINDNLERVPNISIKVEGEVRNDLVNIMQYNRLVSSKNLIEAYAQNLSLSRERLPDNRMLVEYLKDLSNLVNTTGHRFTGWKYTQMIPSIGRSVKTLSSLNFNQIKRKDKKDFPGIKIDYRFVPSDVSSGKASCYILRYLTLPMGNKKLYYMYRSEVRGAMLNPANNKPVETVLRHSDIKMLMDYSEASLAIARRYGEMTHYLYEESEREFKELYEHIDNLNITDGVMPEKIHDAILASYTFQDFYLEHIYPAEIESDVDRLRSVMMTQLLDFFYEIERVDMPEIIYGYAEDGYMIYKHIAQEIMDSV